jgi:hypothetical protein
MQACFDVGYFQKLPPLAMTVSLDRRLKSNLSLAKLASAHATPQTMEKQFVLDAGAPSD